MITMSIALIYSLISVSFVSLISLIGIFSITVNERKLKDILIFFVSFSAGAIFGDVFIHLIPEITAKDQFNIISSLAVISGIR